MPDYNQHTSAPGQLPLSDRPLQPSPFGALLEHLQVPPAPNWPDVFGQSLRQTAAQRAATGIRTLSLFTGAGGLDIGFHDAGFDVLEMVEIDSRFIETLKANVGPRHYFSQRVQLFPGDIAHYDPPKGLKVDFLIGGPPCQTFSAAGRRAAGVVGTQDDRGALFRHYVRLLKKLEPKGFLFENVYGITGAQNGEAFAEIREAFEGAGYEITSRVLDAADFGVPQHRERLFIVGSKTEPFRFPRPTHGPDSPASLPFNAASFALNGAQITSDEASAQIRGRYGGLLEEIPPGLNYSFFTEKMGHPKPLFAWRSKFSDFLYKADPEVPVRTVKAQGGLYTGPFHWDNRPFSVGELKRLQTFPDDYTILGGRTAAVQQIGNSVPPQLARILALAVLQQHFQSSTSIDMPLLNDGEVLGFRRRKRLRTHLYRQRAAAAIDRLESASPRLLSRARTYRATLGKDFSFKEGTSGCRSVSVTFSSEGGAWHFHVAAHSLEKQRFLLSISPTSPSGWQSGLSSVALSGDSLTIAAFTGAWKAFESQLQQASFKADLVQLCGYYQYSPQFKCAMKFLGTNRAPLRWQVLARVVEGVGVREIIGHRDLARAWRVSPEEISSLSRFLRQLGYEVRNHNTNSQIPKGNLLVPYCFPTLSPLSVQLRKTLGSA